MISAQCFHHSDRESVARCPACRRSYCRECITEHEGRVLCARCLQQQLAPAETPMRSLAWLVRPLAIAWGLLATWMVFYTLGWILLRTPSDVHEGTRWQAVELPVTE